MPTPPAFSIAARGRRYRTCADGLQTAGFILRSPAAYRFFPEAGKRSVDYCLMDWHLHRHVGHPDRAGPTLLLSRPHRRIGIRPKRTVSLWRRRREGIARHFLTLIVAAAAIAGCAVQRNEDVAALWRHQDGTAVSSSEIAQARTACVRASARELAPAETDFTSNPAFHPGGEGLDPRRSTMDLNSPTWRNTGRPPIPLADCLEGRGFVRAPQAPQ